MKHIIISVWLFATLMAKSQNPNNHWQLGSRDLNFSTNLPTVNNSGVASQYGLATISDNNGDIILYTDGSKVWNKNHSLIANGDELENTYHEINSVVIVPNPSNANQYYIFRAENYNTLGSTSEAYYNYSIAEFNPTYPQGILLNINSSPGFLENNFRKRLKEASGSDILNMFSFSPLTVATNNTTDAYWVVLQSKNKILSYKIDQFIGLNTIPIESTFTNSQIYNYGYNAASIGFDLHGLTDAMFKMSPDNTKLGGLKYCHYAQDIGIDFKSEFYTLNFNSTTGQFSNFVSAHSVNIYSIVTNFEFSNDSGKVYFTKFGQFSSSLPKGEIVVKDLSNLSSPERLLFQFNNSTVFPSYFNYLQRDKYGNILVSSTFSNSSRNLYVHKIENQNSYSSSSVNVNTISLIGTPIDRLPQIIPVITSACPSNLTITTNITSGVDTKQASTSITASNTISNPASAIYHAGTSVLLTNGFKVTGGAKFRAYIEGCTGNYVARVSNNPDDESQFVSNSDLKNSFKIYPNPSHSMIIVSSDDFKMKQISISSLNDNRVILNQKIDNLESVEVDVSRFEKGIYIVSIESTTGEILTQKLIKN